MTLAATLLIHGRPVLVGDLMLSRVGVERPHTPLPSIEDPAVILPLEWQRHISGIHRKIYIITPRLVVGRTGRLIVAAQAISILKRIVRAEPTAICVNKLFSVLAQCEEQLQENFANMFKTADDLTVVGWLIDIDGCAVQFQWSPEVRQAHSDKEMLARGSGADDFLRYVEDRVSADADVDRSEFTRIAMDSVSLVSLMVADEVATGQGVQQLYGGGFEIVLLTDHGFRYLNDILYVPLRIDGIEQDFASMYRPTYFLKYYYEGGNLAIARKVLSLDSSGSVERDDVSISVVGDFGVNRSDLEGLNIQDKYEFRSSIVSLIVVATTESQGVAYAPFVAGGASPYFQFDENALLINKQLFQRIVPDLKRQILNRNDRE